MTPFDMSWPTAMGHDFVHPGRPEQQQGIPLFGTRIAEERV
ncbi:hypothetical protein [Burkholderia diffusa]|nr:hypothetical protein [Burkholderia diffusa]